MRALPPAQLRRFQALKERCLSVRQIAEQLREPDGAASLRSLDELQLADLDRLLWIYLRTLYTQHMLERFFQSTSVAGDSDRDQATSKSGFAGWTRNPNPPIARGSRQSLQGNLETGKSRLANLEKARENYDLLQAEIENLETKIQSITELAINRSDAEAITGQVEQITQGLVRTEQTINDLGFATGGESFDLTVPNILSREVAGAAQIQRGSAAATAPGRDSIPLILRSVEVATMALAEKRLVLGINCAYHESSAALVRGDEVVFAVEEERFTRTKHAKQARASRTLMSFPGMRFAPASNSYPSRSSPSLDAIAYSLAPGRRLALVGVDPYPLDDNTGFGTAAGRSGVQLAECWGFRACSPARRMIRPSPIDFTSYLTTARTPRVHSTHRRFRRPPFW